MLIEILKQISLIRIQFLGISPPYLIGGHLASKFLGCSTDYS